MALSGWAADYVKLVLAVGRHDANFVDACYGSEAWKAAAEAEALYQVRSPVVSEATFEAALARLDHLLEGAGSVQNRYQRALDFGRPAPSLHRFVKPPVP